VARYPVYNHNAFDSGCSHIGSTSQGLSLSVNSEVMKCDLKIGIGSIEPHIQAGFGGGSKIILPGVCSLNTNEAYHKLGGKLVQACTNTPVGAGIYEGNPVRPVIEEAGKLAGLDFKIDCIFNLRGETTHIFCGSPAEEYSVGVRVAKGHYVSLRALDKDIVIANTYAKASEPMAAIGACTPSVSSQGGDMVLINNSPEGHVVHFLMGTFGRQTGAALQKKQILPSHVNHLIIFTDYPDAAFTVPLSPAEKIIVENCWDKVLDILNTKDRQNKKVKVAVYPGAEVQYFARNGIC
jgi:nickel-dependent lactate racemase